MIMCDSVSPENLDKVEVYPLEPSSHYFEKVIQLGNLNSKTLGFLPEGAFKEHASRGHILIANVGDELAGYLFYNTNERQRTVYISHLCISDQYRRKGISSKLISDLKSRTCKRYRGIRVRCRRDYGINRVWEKNNFHPRTEIPGRSKNKDTLLTFWWFDHGHPDLFTGVFERDSANCVSIAIDANVFFDLMKHQDTERNESHALTAEWIKEHITLYVTTELFNEINRSEEIGRRELARREIDKYPILRSSDSSFHQWYDQVKRILHEPVSDQDKSDMRQLALALANEMEVFCTRDNKLIRRSNEVEKAFGIQILPPASVAIKLDELRKGEEYSPSRFDGTLIHSNRVNCSEVEPLVDSILITSDEKKSELRKRVRDCISRPDECKVVKYHNEGDLLAVVAYEHSNQILRIPVFRVFQRGTAKTFARHLLNCVVKESVDADCIASFIEEPSISRVLLGILEDSAFIEENGVWKKVNMPFTGPLSTFKEIVSEKNETVPVSDAADLINNDDMSPYYLERVFWPAKFTDTKIPTYVIPIQPRWAMQLFDTKLASGFLFGAEPGLLLNHENAYYRSARPKLSAPARILWYVSKGVGKFQGVQAIRACSYLDDVIVDMPKKVFRELRKLGIYKWQDVKNIARDDLAKEIMGIRFSGTEFFRKEIYLSELSAMRFELHESAFTPPQSPRRVSKEFFMKVYAKGMQRNGDA